MWNVSDRWHDGTVDDYLEDCYAWFKHSYAVDLCMLFGVDLDEAYKSIDEESIKEAWDKKDKSRFIKEWKKIRIK